MTKLLLLVSFLGFSLCAQQGPPTPSGITHFPGRLLAHPKDGSDASAIHAAITTPNSGIDSNIQGLNVLVIHVPEASRGRIKASLIGTGMFDFVEDDVAGIATAVVPNDTSIANQPWIGTEKFDSPSDSLGAWDITTGSANLQVAVIDSGINGAHPDLTGKVAAGYNILTGTAIPAGANSDTGCNTGHGTATSGVIGAATNNATGIAGGAWLSLIMPLVVVPSGCTTYWSDIATAAVWAADHGAKVINISIGGPSDSSTLESGLQYAYNHGLAIVASAGNNANTLPSYPASSPYVIASVGAVNDSDVLCSFSSFGAAATVYAAGCNVYTTDLQGSYEYWYGTSFSSPIVASAVALAMTIQPALKPADIKTLIADNSDTIAAGRRLNARKLVAAAQAFTPSTDTTSPVVSITSPVPGAVVSGVISVVGSATDNVGVTGITFLVDGVQKNTALSSPFSFSWDTTAASNTNHAIQVTASDAAGNVGMASLSVSVNNATISPDTTPPTVSITLPASGQITSKSVKVNVAATDNVGLANITVFVDKIQLCSNAVSGLSASVSCTWNTNKAIRGTHTLTATARDTSGNVGTSATVTMTK